MIKKIKKNKIIPIVLQAVQKQKVILKISCQLDKRAVKLLEFLWVSKLILGFTTQPNLRVIIVYLKFNVLQNNLILIKPKVFIKLKNLQKKQK